MTCDNNNPTQTDQTNPTEPTPTPTEPTPNNAPQEPTDYQSAYNNLKAEFDKLKANSRKWESRAKDNSAAAKKAEELEATNKSAEERIAELEKRVAEADAAKAHAEAVKQAAKETGLSESVIATLRGDTAEELTEAAKAIKEAIPSYPVVKQGGHPDVSNLTADQIRAIKDPRERIRARAEHPELFQR